MKSQKARERVKEGITTFIEKKLNLKVNEEKSAVGKAEHTYILRDGLLPEGKGDPSIRAEEI